MGDYKIESNNMLTPNGVPTFGESKHTVRIRHREYLTDIQGSVGFSVQSFNINPGLVFSFPWLSNVAYAYQQYKFKGLLFEYVSTSGDAIAAANNALGSVVMSTQYNATLPNFQSKAEMEQYEYSCSTKPSCSLIHPIECDPQFNPLQHLYIRAGNNTNDLRLYDLGIFQIATQGQQVATTIGELWVTYDVELYKPRIQPGLAVVGDFARFNLGPYVANTNVLGSLLTNPGGALPVSISATGGGYDTLNLPASITAGRFFVYVEWNGGTAANISLITPTLTNAGFSSSLGVLGALRTWDGTPSSGTSNSARAVIAFSFTINGYSAGGSKIQFSNAMTLPGTPSDVTIFVIGLPLTDNYV